MIDEAGLQPAFTRRTCVPGASKAPTNQPARGPQANPSLDQAAFLAGTTVTTAAAARAGVRKGDVIIAIGKEATASIPLEQVALRLRGPVGSEVDLTLSRPGQSEAFRVKLKREAVSPPESGSRLQSENSTR